MKNLSVYLVFKNIISNGCIIVDNIISYRYTIIYVIIPHWCMLNFSNLNMLMLH